jgi:hypothetical protein
MATMNTNVDLSENGNTLEKKFSVLEFHSTKPMAVLQYDLKTVASCAHRKVKAGRLLVQKQMVILGARSALSAQPFLHLHQSTDWTILTTSLAFCLQKLQLLHSHKRKEKVAKLKTCVV